MTSPAPGSVLPGSSVNFTWLPVSGAQQYWIWIGTTRGGMELYNQGQGTNTSATVNGLPTNGAALNVRVFAMVNDAWVWGDYTYTAASPSKAVMTSPISGSTLTGSSQTFNWSAGTGALQYWMWIGTSAGAMDLYNQGQSLNTSATVNGLPMNSSTLYVRLFTMMKDGTWQYNNYTYTASAPTKAAMTSPADLAVLPNSSATFNWTPGVGAQQYWIWIGTSSGAMDLYNQGQGLNTSAVVNGLPTDGSTIYVRLFTMMQDGSWQWNDYSYAAASPAPAVMISPANGSTLPGTSVNFSWTPGIGAQQYWLWVGTMPATDSDTDPARFNFFHQGLDLGTSVTVEGLPTGGTPVYARLFTVLNGAWYWNDYTYTAAP